MRRMCMSALLPNIWEPKHEDLIYLSNIRVVDIVHNKTK